MKMNYGNKLPLLYAGILVLILGAFVLLKSFGIHILDTFLYGPITIYLVVIFIIPLVIWGLTFVFIRFVVQDENRKQL